MRFNLQRRWQAAILVAFLALASAPRLKADVVLEWNALLLQTFADERGSATPPVNSRTMGMLGGAVFDAVNSVNRQHTSYLGFFDPVTPGLGIDVSAAAAAAAHGVLTAVYTDLYGSESAFVTRFESVYESQIQALANTEARTRGIEVGRAAAQAMIAARAGDGWNASSSYQPQPLGTVGRWQPGDSTGAWGAAAGTFVKPQWAALQPFTMSSPSQFRPGGPNGFNNPQNYQSWINSTAYVGEFNQVRDLGGTNSLMRTTDQTNIAFFWMDGPGTASPPGHWSRIAATVAEQRGLTIEQNARLFGLLGLGMADAGIAAWEAKVHYDTWRPMYAINTANADGNPLTIQDASWAPLIPTPSFGAYVSGHSTFSMTGATILRQFFGTDQIAFDSTSESLMLPMGYTRSFGSFTEAALEAGMSRIYGGIHWMSDNVDGAILGENVGNQVFNTQMLPIPEPGSLLLVVVAAGFGLRRRRSSVWGT